MMKKSEIIEMCKNIATEFPGWEYSAGVFKNKEASPCIKIVHPFWSFSPGTALAQPRAGFRHKVINGLFKKLMGVDTAMLCYCHLSDPPSEYSSGLRFYHIVEDRAEERIRKMLTDGIVVLEKKYDFSSEKNLLENMPKYSGQTLDVCYCLIRAYLGDFDYVRDFRLNMTEDANGSDYQSRIDKVVEHFGIELQSNLVGRGN